jgi:hypothetical protein
MLRLACSLAVAALIATGCGDSDDEPDTQPVAPQAPPASTTTSTTPEREQRAAEPETAAKRERLEQAGFDDVVASGVEGVEPQPRSALEFPLDGGGQVTVFVYASPDDARTKAAEFEKLARRYPDFFRAVVRGSTAYVGVAEEPDRLDRAAFDKAVDAAEG